MKNDGEWKKFPQRVRFIEVQTESYQYVKTISWRKRIHSLLFVAVRQLWASQSDCCQQRSNDTPATSIDQNWHGVHTHSFHEHQSGEQKAGRSCIYQNNINHQRRHHVCPVLASHPGRGGGEDDDDINNNWGETWSGGGEAARNVWPSVNNWTRASGKNRACISLTWSDTL